MKIRLFYLAVFILALLTGILSAFPFLTRPDEELQKEGTLKVFDIEISASRPQDEAKPEVFDIDGAVFIDEWPEYGFEMLEVGKNWSLDKPKHHSGDKLLGLYYEGHKTFLRSSVVKLTRHTDDSWNVSVDRKAKPRFLLPASKLVREGKVITVFTGFSSRDEEVDDYGYGTSKLDDLARDRVFDLGDNRYTFSVKTGVNRSGEKIVALLLENNGQSQIINTSNFSDTPILGDNLLWAGDIDHDNKLDFYMEFFNEKGAYWTGLFLSSKAEKGKLVQLSGGFSSMGC